MSDNLFDRLFELFQTSDRVNWRLAEEVTKSISGAAEPIEPTLAEEYEELALAAQLRLADASSLDLSGGVIPHPIDRAGWARSNHRAFEYLAEPMSGVVSGSPAGSDPMSAMLAPLGPALLGMQSGTLVGFMSHTVLGQFDAAVPPLDEPGAYLVVPNVEGFADEHGLDARQVRLWATMHELVYAAVSAGDGVRAHFAAAVSRIFAEIDIDQEGLVERLSGLQDPAQLEGMLSEGDGLGALFGIERDPRLAEDVLAAAAFIEGYGDFVVRRAAAAVLPDLDRIEAAHRGRREQPDQASEQLAQLLGVAVDRSRAASAHDLCVEIERRWGADALEKAWVDPGNLPSLDELTDPVGWAARVLLD